MVPPYFLEIEMNDFRIKCTNSAIIIDNYNLGESLKLEHMFSKYDPITHKYSLEAVYYDEENHSRFCGSSYYLPVLRQCVRGGS